jgi:hypothetical protein
MTARPKSRPDPLFPDLEPLADLLHTPPMTVADRLRHIRVLGERIDGYIRFMCAVDRMGGSSAEAKEKAVAAFLERLAAIERELAQIQRSTPRRLRSACRRTLAALPGAGNGRRKKAAAR